VVVSLWIHEPHLTIGGEVKRTLPVVQGICDEVIKRLQTRLGADSITTAFDFPDEVKVPCEQYLVYFVQFLRDIGVEATSDLQHYAGRVLFKDSLLTFTT
jgi:hypothetical protein